ncbi:MAG: DNRLRE domain-containing protein [Bacteroidetes bacterium]|nr:DNRLRE domain-containing protein [Bacteroidota bacterium]
MKNILVRKSCILLYTAIILSGILVPANAQVVFNPSADSYIHDVNANVNYGTANPLLVKKGTASNFRKAYIKFDLTTSGITAASSAILRIYATTSLAVDMNIHQVSDAWTELGITWNNAPAEGTIVATTSLLAAAGYYEWDITSYVQSQLAGSDKIISVVVYSATVTSGTINFTSREAATNKPELVVTATSTTPAAPSNLSATAFSSGHVDLSWTDNSDSETGFRVERKTGSGTYGEIAVVGSNVASYSDLTTSANTTYTYRVRAYNTFGNSDYSNEASVTTPAPPPLPLAPTGLVVTPVSQTQLDLGWVDASSNEEGFKIERKTGSGSYSEIASLGPNITSYSNTGLTANTAYTYRVYAYNVSGNSAYSNEATASTLSPPQITYYIDALNGSDGNTGLSEVTAWKTLTKVNATTFSANNRILFKAGQVWTGRLYPKGSGSAGFPIIIDMYGSGNKPLIDGNGMTGTGVVYLYNQQYWEINNLEVTNDAAVGDDRRGVRIEAENYGTANHIYLRNLNIHNIKGSIGQNRSDKRTSGIGYAIVDASTTDTHFNDILVENCVITSCDNQGIITECVTDDGFDPYTPQWNAIKITNAVIRNNTISDISKNAMIIRLFEGGVVEHNVCFNTATAITGNTIFSASCSGTVFQYNEGYNNLSPDYDGSLYDADLRSPNTYWQYSYSHDNAHGLFWTCTVQADVNVVCRYNISQNDHGNIFCINYPVNSCFVYNNTVYVPSTLSPLIISERNNGGSGARVYSFKNNLIYNLSSSAAYDWTSGYSRTIDYNCFYGVHPSTEPSDPHKVTGDPKLAGAGTGGTGIGSVNGYKLLSGSSCINKGTSISNNGGFDYWGNPLYNGLPDIGAHEYTLPPLAPSVLTATAVPPSQVNLSWTDNSSNELGFRIERKEGSGTYSEIAVVSANVNTYSNTGLTPGIAYTYRVTAYSAAGNSAYSNEASVTIAAFKTLNLGVLIEGLYLTNGTMRKAQDSSGDHYPGNVADQITVELHNSSSYSVIEYSAPGVNLSTAGNSSLQVPYTKSGSYYITVRHRNSIETCSAIPVSFSATTINYNFDAVSKAYGNNLKPSGDGKWLIYSGDVNQDGVLDFADMLSVDNDISSSASGYLATDIDGNGIVNILDLDVIDVSSSLFIFSVTP